MLDAVKRRVDKIVPVQRTPADEKEDGIVY
jgi:hypothetical protein